MRRTYVLNLIAAAAILATLVIPVLAPVAPAQAAGSYGRYTPIVIDAAQVDVALTDFPVLINSTIPQLATTANGGKIENTASGGASGSVTVPADFIIDTDDQCDTTLDFEVEKYDETTGAIVVHVKVPSLSDTADTTLYLCYGDAGVTTSQENISGVWSNGYEAVYHFAVNDGVAYDSTANGNDASDYASATNYNGKIGDGQAFDDADDYYHVAASTTLKFGSTADFSLSAWIYSSGDGGSILGYGDRDDAAGITFYGRDTGRQVLIDDGTTQVSVDDSTPLANSTWNLAYVVADRDGLLSLYKNGGEKISGSISSVGSLDTIDHDDWAIGRVWYQSSFGNYYGGNLDEVRIARAARSDGWISTTYNNQSTPETFYSVGTETEIGAWAMGTPSVTVPQAVLDAIETRLNNYRPNTESNLWAVTDLSDTDTAGYQYFSLLGLIVDDPNQPGSWTLEKGIWTGAGIVRDNGDGTYLAGIEGDGGTYNSLISEAAVVDPAYQPTGGAGSPYFNFPWQAGTLAWYGVKGVHGAGPYGPDPYADYVAVDFVGGSVGYADSIMPNAVFASETATINFVCRDDYQVWVGAGNFLYGHLVDNEKLRMGNRIIQGENIGAMVVGPLDRSWAGVWCGEADQRSTSYHLHFGFKPEGGYFQIEKWILDVDAETWRYGSEAVAPQDYLKAEWDGGVINLPTPTPGGPTPTPGGGNPPPEGGGGTHIWDGLLNAVSHMAQERVDELDDVSENEPERNIPLLVLSGVRVAIRTTYVMMVSNINMTVTLVIFGLMAIMETVRILRAIWMGIKELVPFIG